MRPPGPDAMREASGLNPSSPAPALPTPTRHWSRDQKGPLMAAELSLADEHTDELHRITLLTSAARSSGLTPDECVRLDDLISLAEARANEIAAMYRVSTALMRRGRTEHTTELVRSVLRLTG